MADQNNPKLDNPGAVEEPDEWVSERSWPVRRWLDDVQEVSELVSVFCTWTWARLKR